jgi:hypothetical protein
VAVRVTGVVLLAPMLLLLVVPILLAALLLIGILASLHFIVSSIWAAFVPKTVSDTIAGLIEPMASSIKRAHDGARRFLGRFPISLSEFMAFFIALLAGCGLAAWAGLVSQSLYFAPGPVYNPTATLVVMLLCVAMCFNLAMTSLDFGLTFVFAVRDRLAEMSRRAEAKLEAVQV